jgi:subtilisin family serine protease
MFTLLTIFFLQFANKAGSDIVCLSPTALEMRQERGIPIDSLDYAVSPVYLDSIKSLGANVLHTSRWMNGATIEASTQVILTVEKFSFVDTIYLTRGSISPLNPSSISLQKRNVITSNKEELDVNNLGSNGQLHLMNLLPLHKAGYKGHGIRIGIADGGFYNADSLPSLEHAKDQWLGYTDFTDDPDDIFGKSGNHGTLCLSTIMAKKSVSDSVFINVPAFQGAATEAEYYLFRTEEHASESLKEIDNWVAAIEMADSLGLHIVTTSLGYTTFDNKSTNFSYSDMDGRTSRGAQAAAIATRKGMLLVAAAGNDGNKSWHYLSTPADADSILTVGAVNIDKQIAAFSSYGPSADGRVKPEVCAVGEGTTLINPANDAIMSGNGTSFACPLVAGMAACLWSALPQATNMEIRERIIRSADRYAQPHEQYGYGIPDAWLAYTQATTNSSTPQLLNSSISKIIQNGHIYIIYNGQLYDLLGNKIN